MEVVIHRTCIKCGSKFTRLGPRVKPANLMYFCSEECEKDIHKVSFTCAFCGKEAKRIASKVSNRHNNYCSKECSFQAHSKQ